MDINNKKLIMAKYTVRIPTISCGGCAGAIKTALASYPNIQDLEVRVAHDGSGQGGFAEFNLSQEDDSQSKQQIEAILADCGHTVDWHNSIVENAHHLRKAIISGGLGLLLVILSVSGLVLPTAAMAAIGALTSVTLWYSARDILRKGLFGMINHGSMTMETLFTLSTLTALGLSFAAFFVPGLAFEFETALLIFGSHHLGKHIENKMKQRLSQRLNFKSALPATVDLVHAYAIDGLQRTEQVAISALKPGDIVYLEPNSMIPADGEIASAQAEIYRTFINGNLLPETASKGEKIYAGMKIGQHGCYYKVSHSLTNSLISQIDDQLANTEKLKTNTERMADKVIQYFVPGVLFASVITLAVAMPLFGVSIGIHSAMAILVGACPCTLGFIAPLTIKVGLDKSAKHGALINNPQAIEAAPDITNVVFDLNGTLTKGSPEVAKVTYLDSKIDQTAILNIVYQMEQATNTTHPIGHALKQFAHSHLGATPHSINSIELHQSHTPGIIATIDGHRYALGNASLMNGQGIELSKTKAQQIFLAKDNQLIAIFDIVDPLHPNAKATLDALRQMGKTPVLCTGADQVTADSYAVLLGISQVKANCHGGQEKSDYIDKELGANACMVGDAANDALPLHTAAIGIAMENADEVSKDHADVQIRHNGLLAIPHFFQNAANTMSTVKQNLSISLIYNISVTCLTAWVAMSFGAMAPGLMALGMGLQSLLVLANTYRLNLAPVAQAAPPTTASSLTELCHSKIAPGFKPKKSPDMLPLQCDAEKAHLAVPAHHEPSAQPERNHSPHSWQYHI